MVYIKGKKKVSCREISRLKMLEDCLREILVIYHLALATNYCTGHMPVIVTKNDFQNQES